MRKLKSILTTSALVIFGLTALLWSVLYLKYGGGETYPDLSTEPIFPDTELSVVATFNQPFGNLAVSNQRRIFFTVHPEARPEGSKLFEWVNGEARAFPDSSWQADKFNTVLGLCIDAKNRLWVLDHGNHGTSPAAVWAFELESGKEVYHHSFPKALAPIGSFFNDIQLSKDGRYLIISDASFFGQDPALVVHDTDDKKSVRRLAGHPSVLAEDYLVKHPSGSMEYLAGSLALKLGVNGIILGPEGRFLYYASLNHHGLYRIPMATLCNYYLDDSELNEKVEFLGEKPLSDGLSVDVAGNIYICDIEHSGIAVWSSTQGLKTLVRSEEKIRWADGLSFGPDSCLYFTDSALPDVILKSQEYIEAHAPFFLYKLKLATPGFAGR